MKYTLEELMQQVGCDQYPIRWQTIFDAAMKRYDESGCYLADPAYYDSLQAEYGCMETYGQWYGQAAQQVAQEEPLGRFLTLLSMALEDQEHRLADISELALLKPPADKEPLGYRMITGLAVCSQLSECKRRMVQRDLPEEMQKKVLTSAVNCGVSTHMRHHAGVPGYSMLKWAQRYIEARLFAFGKLVIELNRQFEARAMVFTNAKGEQVILAHDIQLHESGYALGSKYCEDTQGAWTPMVEETADAWIGFPCTEDGRVSREKTVLDKSQWTKRLSTGDPVVVIHIGSGKGALDPVAMDESFRAARAFLAKYYPDYNYKAFSCYSWLMDPKLIDFVGADSNIGRFNALFGKVTRKSHGNDIFNFVFGYGDLNFNLADLPERTRLEKALKEYYIAGNVLYEPFGFILR